MSQLLHKLGAGILLYFSHSLAQLVEKGLDRQNSRVVEGHVHWSQTAWAQIPPSLFICNILGKVTVHLLTHISKFPLLQNGNHKSVYFVGSL